MAQFREPQARYGACGATVGDNFFVYRGWHSSFRGMQTLTKISNIEEFNTTSLEWVERETSGSSPPGPWDSASAATSQHLYHFGGSVGKTYTNVLSELNISSRNWRKIHPVNPTEGPMRKGGCGMISINDEMLCITCGYGIPDGRTPINSRFVKDTKSTKGCGWSNELHLFNMKTALWRSPPTTGQGPPPCSGCSFTRVDKKKAVMFGGYQPEVKKRVADTYILNFETWHWTALLRQASSQPWPSGRALHTAFSLYDPDSNPPHPCLAVACGMDSDLTPLNDLWVLSVEEQYWEEVPLPDSFPPRWFHTGGVVHKSQTQARATFFGGCPDSTRKYASAREWPCMAQTTLIDLELDLTKMKRGESTGWVAVSVKDSTAIAATRIYEEALQYGYVNSQAALCLLSGAAGSGKTHVKLLLFGKNPPTLRQSTPLAEAPVRAISYARVDASDEKWYEVDDKDQSQMLADALAAGISLDPHIASSAKAPDSSSEDDRQPTHPSSSPTFADGATIPAPEAQNGPKGDVLPQKSSSHLLKSHLPPEQHGAAVVSKSSLTAANPATALEEQLIKLISKSSGSKKFLDVSWIYLLDTGGQPQFHHMLPLFMPGTALAMFVTKLCERLDQHPSIEYYEEGQCLSSPYTSPHTHRQILQHLFQAVVSQIYAPGKQQPQVLVVGTHRDQEHKCSETREEKNKKLVSLLSPVPPNQLVFYGQELKQLIFPVNAKTPEQEDQEVARELRKAILDATSAVKPRKTPVAWYLLEQALRKVAKEFGRSVLRKEECFEVAQRLQLSRESFEAALDHFSQLKVILYFHDLLPDIVFTDPQVVLDKLSEPVKHSYKLRGYGSAREFTSGKWLRFRNEGLITPEFLQEFPQHYERDLFTPHDFIRVLEHNLLAAKIADKEYFMPSILPELPQEEVAKHRVEKDSPVAPLALFFKNRVVPSGLYCSLVASLLSPQSSNHWELLPNATPTTPHQPECVTRNCIMFKPPLSAPGSLTLIDAFSHIEVHIDTPSKVASTLCPQIRKDILQHLAKAARSLHYRMLKPKVALLCEKHCSLDDPLQPETVSQSHIATISEHGGSHWWTCSQCPGRLYGELIERHLIWFNEHTLPPSLTSHSVREQIDEFDEPALKRPRLTAGHDLPSQVPDVAASGDNHPRIEGSCTPLNATADLHLQESVTISALHDPHTEGGYTLPHATEEHPLEVDQSEDKHVNQAASIFCNPEHKEPPHPLGDVPKLHQLQCIRRHGGTRVKVIETVAARWEDVALALHLEGHVIEAVRQDVHFQTRSACRQILQKWLEGEGRKPVTWNTLITALDDAEFVLLAEELQAVLNL